MPSTHSLMRARAVVCEWQVRQNPIDEGPRGWLISRIARELDEVRDEESRTANISTAARYFEQACRELIFGEGTATSQQRVIDLARRGLGLPVDSNAADLDHGKGDAVDQPAKPPTDANNANNMRGSSVDRELRAELERLRQTVHTLNTARLSDISATLNSLRDTQRRLEKVERLVAKEG